MACLLLGTSVVVAWHLITTGGAARWRAALRSGLVLATAPLTALALSGPPFFPTRAALGAGTSQRGAVESLGGNTSARLDHWSQAWSIFADRPLTGAGFHSFAAAARDVGPPEGVVTAFAHNGYLQALADGGLLLFVPVLLCLAGLALAVLRRLRDGGTHDPVLVGAVTCLGMALLHSGIDFDWDYPALLALTAVLAAATASVRRARPVPSRARVVPLVAVTAALLCLGAITAWSGGLDLNAGTMGG
jgi:O-antigen ligase